MSEHNFDEWSGAHSAIQMRVDNACIEAGHETAFVAYSAYMEDERGLPVDNLDEVFAEGIFRVCVPGDDFFGNGEPYVSNLISNPTWMDLAVLANESIPVTGDTHHIFFENAEVVEPGLIELSFGS